MDHGRSGCARPSAVAIPRLCWLESVGACRPQGPASGVTGERRTAVPSPAHTRPPADVHRRCRVVGVPREQAHVPAEQPPSVEDPRVPAADADPRGPGDPRRPSAQGSREALRLTCCPRRHACAGVRSSPRSSGPDGAPGGRPWCSTTSPNGPSRLLPRGRRRRAARRRCAGRFRRRQGRRQLGGPPPRDPAPARRRRRRAAPAARLGRSGGAGPARGRRRRVGRAAPRPRPPAWTGCWATGRTGDDRPPAAARSSASTRGPSAPRCRRGAGSTRPAAPTPPRRSPGTARPAAAGWRCAGWSSARPGTPAAWTWCPSRAGRAPPPEPRAAGHSSSSTPAPRRPHPRGDRSTERATPPAPRRAPGGVLRCLTGCTPRSPR